VIMRDHAADMAVLERRHRAGDRRAAIDAIYISQCSEPAKPTPDWARWAFHRAYGRVFGALAESWDEEFGKPLKPRERLAAKRKRKEMETVVWKRVRTLNAGGAAIGRGLFESVAKDVDMGRRQVEEMFYACERAFGRRSNLWGPPPELPFSTPEAP
jgi:hypothetical protein